MLPATKIFIINPTFNKVIIQKNILQAKKNPQKFLSEGF